MIPFELIHRLFICFLLRERERERERERDDAEADSSIRIVYTHIAEQIFFSK